MFKFQLFSPHRLVFGKPFEQPEGLPDTDLPGFTGKCSGNICDKLIGNPVDGENDLKADINNVVMSYTSGAFRTGTTDGEYLIISGRDGETIGKINVIMMNGVPTVKTTQFIPTYTPDLKSYTYEEKITYYKTAADFKADLGMLTEDLRAD